MKRTYLLLIAAALLVSLGCSKKSVDPGTGGGGVSFPNGKDLPAGVADGVTILNSGTSVIFDLTAPGKSSVSIIGEFNNWQPAAMTPTPDGTHWWIQIDGLTPTTEYAYQYLIDGTIKVADPYTEKVLDPANDPGIPASVYPNLKAYPAGQTGIVSIVQPVQPAYTWTTTNFTRAAPKNLVVYELLVRDFVATHSYSTLKDTISYLANLGVNAIELMPVNEFEGNDSWGYNTNFGMALDKYYGTKNAYKAFIDACHAKGIAVIQDFVLEDQFGSSPMVRMYCDANGVPTADNPWFDVANMHPDAVGYQLNHQSAYTQYYTERVMKYWMQEYHIDGYRFDEAKGYTQTYSADEASWANYDAGRVATWKAYNSYMKGIDPNFYVILEYFAGNQEESELANQGMMMWNNLSGSSEQATMGYATNPSWDISGLFYNQFSFTAPYALISYFESHDEERLMYKNEQFGNSSGSYTTKDIPTGLKRNEMGAVFMFSSPGPKMLWQFGELGYDYSVNYNGRLGDKPIVWNYTSDVNRKHLQTIYSKMIKWKINNPVFATTNFSYSLAGPVKWIQLLDLSTNVEVVGNFDVVSQSTSINFPAAGTYYDNITGTSITVPSSTSYAITLAPGEYHLYSTTALH